MEQIFKLKDILNIFSELELILTRAGVKDLKSLLGHNQRNRVTQYSFYFINLSCFPFLKFVIKYTYQLSF